MSSKGVTLAVLGQFEDSEKYHFGTLKLRLQHLGNEHHAVGATYNNIGLMYHQKGDVDNALKYFTLGLEIKRKSNAPDLSLVSSMTNIASLACALGQYKEAHRMLDEAEIILNRQEVLPGDPIAYLNETRGVAFRQEGKLVEAREMAEKAVERRAALSPNSPTYVESLSQLAEVCRLQKDYRACQHYVAKAIKAQETVVKAMPQHLFIKDCLECLAKVHEERGDKVRHRSTLGRLESELLRLEREIGEANHSKLQIVRTALDSVKSKLDKLSLNSESSCSVSLVSRESAV